MQNIKVGDNPIFLLGKLFFERIFTNFFIYTTINVGDNVQNQGILDLTKLFEEEYHLEDKSFFLQPFVELETVGKRKKFWFYYKNNKFLYKKTEDNLYEGYGEIISQKIAHILEIPCASYMLAKFNYKDKDINDFENSVGIISQNFLENGERYIPFGEIISDVIGKYIHTEEAKKNYDIDGVDEANSIKKLNNLESLWSILDLYFQNYPDKQEIVENLT